MTKPWYKSKVLWVNILALVTYAAKTWGGVTALDVVQPETGFALLAVVNIILRLFTKEPVV